MAGQYGGFDPYAFGVGAPGLDFPFVPLPGAYGAPGSNFGGPASADELRSIFVTGFPEDVKERELNNLCRFMPGYEASQMNWKNGQAQGFALFSSGALARAAVEALHQMCFDDAQSNYLRAEMARKNMYIRDDMEATKRLRVDPYEGSRGPGGGGGGVGGSSGRGGYAGTSPLAPGAMGGGVGGGGPGGGAPRQQGGYTRDPQRDNAKDNPPCNTLFVGNLGEAVTEDELNRLFGPLPGFCQLKVLRNAKNVTCFCEFDTVETAIAVHNSQQGAMLPSSDRGGLRIQFSKNPFGKKREFGSGFVDSKQYAGSGGGGGGSGSGGGGGRGSFM